MGVNNVNKVVVFVVVVVAAAAFMGVSKVLLMGLCP